MNLREAIFNRDVGAILYFPSSLIVSSMEVLIESAKKGPKIVARSMITISNYVAKIHQVNERLKDLLSEIVSSMKSQISFLAPVIAGVVVGVSSMIVTILTSLSSSLETIGGEGGTIGGIDLATAETLISIFDVTSIVPSYYFQFVIGVFVIEIIWILSILSNGIENGADKLNEEYLIGRNLKRSMILYFIVSLLVVLVLNALAYAAISIPQI